MVSHSATSNVHDLVVIGASAGGVETLRNVVSGLPADLPAAVCVVLHIAPSSPSALARILDRAGPLPCRTASDGAELRLGTIVVAPPDRHLVVEGTHARLTVGPRENGHRPSADVLFRSAATSRDGRVLGVVLSGTRDDGAAGLAAIKAAGGAAIVQDPADALYGGMPENALQRVAPDAVVRSDQVAATVVAIVKGERLPEDPDVVGAGQAGPATERGTTTVCPECGGVLSERLETGVLQWECRVGHRYSPDSLLDAQGQAVEATLWAAIRALEDRVMLLERMEEQVPSAPGADAAQALHKRARRAIEQARMVRGALELSASDTRRDELFREPAATGGEPHDRGDGEAG